MPPVHRARTTLKMAVQALPPEPAATPLRRVSELLQRAVPLWPWCLACGLVCAALVCNFHRIAGYAVWYDEDYSYGLASQSLVVMWRSLWGPFQNMTLYYLFLHSWLGMLRVLSLPPTEVLLRGPSAFFSAVSVGVIFMLGRRCENTIVGAVGASLYLLSYWQIYAAQEARAYALMMLLVCVGWYALAMALASDQARHRNRWLLAYVAVMTCAVYAHLWSGLVLLAQACAVATVLVLPNRWQLHAKGARMPLAACFAAIALLVSPIAVDAAVNGGASTWIAPVGLGDLKAFLYSTFGGQKQTFLLLGAIVAIGLAVPVLSLHMGWWPRSHGRATELATDPAHAIGTGLQVNPGVLMLLCWLIIPMGLSYAATQPQVNLHLFYPRYLMAVAPAFWLLVGLGVSALPWRPLQFVVLAGLVLTALNRMPSYYAQLAALPNPTYRLTTTWLEAHFQTGDGLACYGADICSPPIDYYLHAYPGPAHFDVDSPGRWNWATLATTADDPATLATYSAKHPHVCLLLASPPGAGTTPIQAWLDTHARLATQFANLQYFRGEREYAISVRCYATSFRSTGGIAWRAAHERVSRLTAERAGGTIAQSNCICSQ